MSKKIKSIIQKLESYKPDKVVLFGSYAWGKPDKDSDFDLLIIKDTKKNPYKRIPEVRKKLNDLDFAFDILVLTPDELDKNLRANNFFFQDIIDKGKILYERK
ncbi:MAG: nucleotidyltransferase domain-containing protein [Patescibacteria group bacterium]